MNLRDEPSVLKSAEDDQRTKPSFWRRRCLWITICLTAFVACLIHPSACFDNRANAATQASVLAEPSEDDRNQPTELARAKAVLQGKGLVKSSSVFVLDSEPDANAKIGAVRSSIDQFNMAKQELAEAQWAVESIKALDTQIRETNANISDLAYQMKQFPAASVRGRSVRGTDMGQNNAFEQLQSHMDFLVRSRDVELIPERDRLRSHAPGEVMKRATVAKDRARSETLGALNDAREAVNGVSRIYEKLANDPEVQSALKSIGLVTLGPSPEFRRLAEQLAVQERWAGLSTMNDLPVKPTTGKRGQVKTSTSAPAKANNGSALYNRAHEAEDKGQFGSAIGLYRTIIKSYPNSEIAKKASDRLKAIQRK